MATQGGGVLLQTKIPAAVLAREPVLDRVPVPVALVLAVLAQKRGLEQGTRRERTACTRSKGRNAHDVKALCICNTILDEGMSRRHVRVLRN